MTPLTAEEQIEQEKVLRAVEKEMALEKLEAEILKGIKSGYGGTDSPEFWEMIRQRIQERIDQKNKNHSDER